MDESNGDGCGCMMMMVMTFGDWDDYKLKLLWEEWDIQDRTQFAFSCIAVMVCSVIYHFLLYLGFCIDRQMATLSAAHGSEALIDHESGVGEGTKLRGSQPAYGPQTDRAMLILRLKHAAIAALQYTLALLLMLVAMTYNPSLFLCLCLGYGLGDFLFAKDLVGSSRIRYGCH